MRSLQGKSVIHLRHLRHCAFAKPSAKQDLRLVFNSLSAAKGPSAFGISSPAANSPEVALQLFLEVRHRVLHPQRHAATQGAEAADLHGLHQVVEEGAVDRVAFGADLAQQHGVTATYISSDLSAKAMAFGSGLIAVGRSKPVVARIMKLQDAAQAQARVSAGSVIGKVVLEVG